MNKASLTLCEDDDGLAALADAMTVLLRGVDLKATGLLERSTTLEDHQRSWRTWLAANQEDIKHAISASYQAAQNFEVEKIVAAARSLDHDGQCLTQAMFDSMAGAPHQRLLKKLQRVNATEPDVMLPPSIAFAVKGALFNINLPATQLAYFHHEWRASGGALFRRESASIEAFLQTPEHVDLLRIEWQQGVDSELSHSIFQRHG